MAKLYNTQQTQRAFREATNYAQLARMQQAYIDIGNRVGVTAYNIAIMDWFCAPKVLEINVDHWTGKIGQTIRVKARDNVRVARVSVVIWDCWDNVLEMGDAVPSQENDAWWIYTTRSSAKMTPFPIVEATAEDLAGNRDSFVIN